MDEGAGWEAAVEAAPGPTPLIGEQQAKAVQRINAYFNGITNLQGSFDQVDSTNKHTSGRFYVQRPGKIRFDYAPPSALRIVADGAFLAIEDSDLKTVEKYPIKSTPFRLLLTDAVDLGRDARIVGVESEEGTLAISLEDNGGDAAGTIKLTFDYGPELRLKQWLITDAQGLTTLVTVDNIVSGRKVAADFFTSTQNFQPFGTWSRDIRNELNRQSPWPLDFQEHSLVTARNDDGAALLSTYFCAHQITGMPSRDGLPVAVTLE